MSTYDVKKLLKGQVEVREKYTKMSLKNIRYRVFEVRYKNEAGYVTDEYTVVRENGEVILVAGWHDNESILTYEQQEETVKFHLEELGV